MSIDAYSVAVKVSLVENVTRGLQLMSRHFATTDAQAKALEKSLKGIATQAMAGAALMAGGAFGLHLLKAPLDEAKKYQVELARFASLGFGDRVNNQADAFARGMHTIGTSARDNMALVGDAMAVFKDIGHAQMAAPIMARMKFANEVLFGAEAGAANDRKLMDMMKVIEFRGGLSSSGEFSRQADYAQKAIAGSRGRVDATALLSALKTGGVALSRRSNEAFYLGGEPLIQEFGGSRYGTAAMSIYQNLVQARGTVTAQQELYRLGLLNPAMVQFNQLGQLKKARPGAFTGSSILENEGELALMQKVLLPAFAKAGINTDEGVIREFGMILGNRTGSGLMSRIYQQWKAGSLGRMISANQHAMGINAAYGMAAGTTAGKEIDLAKREADLKLEIGRAIMPTYVKMLEMTRNMLVSITAFAKNNPTIFKGLVGTFAALSGAALVGGGLTLLTAGLRGLALLGPLIGMAGRAMPLVRLLSGGLSIFFRSLVNEPLFVAGFRMIGPFFTAGIRALVPFLMEGISSFLAAIGPVGWTLLAVGAAAVVAYKNWDTLKVKWGEFSTWLSGAWSSMIEMLKSGIYAVHHPIDTIGHALGFGNTVKPAKAPAASHGNVYMDGNKVGHIVTKYQSRMAERPNTGGSSFDGSRAPWSAGVVR